ncbi:hypothetical protein NOR53_415 [gamma proteobacterium NOR5-3]|nr:hypothetical protein NOR53_415 [gamma proteobacterium NOR5-3]
MNSIELERLYFQRSKHSQYQVLSPFVLSELCLAAVPPSVKRYEAERFDAVARHTCFEGKSVLDIGGNTGYFTFESLAAGAESVVFVEGNGAHTDFVGGCAKLMGLRDRVKLFSEYYDPGSLGSFAEIGFLLNVLHHNGEDYGDAKDSDACLLRAENALALLSDRCERLVFQIGYNWKGSVDYPLFNNGTKTNVIDWLCEAVKGRWIVQHVLIAVSTSSGGIEYRPVDSDNIERDDRLGEFLNRPLFILDRC